MATQSEAAVSLPPLEAREVLIKLLRGRAPREEVERAADGYREAIRELGLRTKRKLPSPRARSSSGFCLEANWRN